MKVLLVSVLILFACGDSIAINSVHVEVDRINIVQSGAFSGIIQIDLSDRTSLVTLLPLRNQDFAINIIFPNGETFVVNKELVEGGLHYDKPIKMSFDSGLYRVPFFVLKTDDRYLFEMIGEHKISFVFPEEFGVAPVEVEVSVIACEDCGEEDFKAYFSNHSAYLYPFQRDLVKREGAINNGVYQDMLDLCRAYCAGSLLTKRSFWADNGEFEKMDGVDHEQYSIEFSQGLSAARKAQVNTDFWEYLNEKNSTIKSKGVWFEDRGLKSLGYRYYFIY